MFKEGFCDLEIMFNDRNFVAVRDMSFIYYFSYKMCIAVLSTRSSMLFVNPEAISYSRTTTKHLKSVLRIVVDSDSMFDDMKKGKTRFEYPTLEIVVTDN